MKALPFLSWVDSLMHADPAVVDYAQDHFRGVEIRQFFFVKIYGGGNIIWKTAKFLLELAFSTIFHNCPTVIPR